MTKRNAGFTLIELMIVVAIIAIIAAVAIPKLLSARIAANENAAIATLRSVSAAQQQLQSSCAIDTNADGGGEYGFFGELAGSAPLRVFDAATLSPNLGAAPVDLLDPPFLATAFGNILADGTGAGIVERQGYYFKIYLPQVTPAGGGATNAFAEDPTVGVGGATAANVTGGNWGSDNCEIMWSAYAWPVDAQKTGNRCFFLNQEGDLIQYDNRDQQYETINSVPTFDAALDNTVAADFDSPLGLAALNFTANDGNVWTVVGN